MTWEKKSTKQNKYKLNNSKSKNKLNFNERKGMQYKRKDIYA